MIILNLRASLNYQPEMCRTLARQPAPTATVLTWQALQVSRRANAAAAAGRLKHAGAAGAAEAAEEAAGVPGTERVWVKTFGCSHNFSDGEYMAGQLQAYGYRRVQSPIPL